MKKGRPTMPRAEDVITDIDPERAAGALVAVDQLAALDADAQQRTQQLATKLGYDGPLDPDVIERCMTVQMRRTLDACLETGRMLLLLKERVGHGNFIERLERLGIEYRGAAKFMQAALKFSNVPSTAHLAKAINSQTKAMEFLLVDDEVIAELATTGSALGYTSDEFGAMSVKEAREVLRAQKTLIASKSETIDKLVLENERLKKFKPKPDDLARTAEQANQLKELNEACMAAQIAVLRLANVSDALLGNDAMFENPLGNYARECLSYVAGIFANMANTHGIDLKMEELMGSPPWLGMPAIEAAANDAAPAGKKSKR